MSATRKDHCTTGEQVLYMAFELGEGRWKLGFTLGLGQEPRRVEVAGRDMVAVGEEIRLAKKRFGLSAKAPVVSCYEAGRDGFWVHRCLVAGGVENVVVDSASIEVNRRLRRAKTDRLDLRQLVRMLVRWHQGEKGVWSVVRIPSVAEEDARQLHRELETLRQEQTAHTNRIRGLLASHGVVVIIDRRFPQRLKSLRQWDGSPLPEDLQRRLLREFQRMQLANRHIRHLETERARRIRGEDKSPTVAQVRQLMRLKGIGTNSAWLFVHEVFGWREIRNRRQLGAVVGLVPTPYASGQDSRELGISKAGNRRMRAIAIEIGWGWLRHQGGSALSRWYRKRFGRGSKRQRKIGIVALARKLLVGLLKYLQTGVPPQGVEVGDWRGKFQYTPSLG